MKRINIGKSAQKELGKIDAATRKRIINGIIGLCQEPPIGDTKPLKGELRGLNRLRVGQWRIVYEIAAEAIDILDISPRGGAYK